MALYGFINSQITGYESYVNTLVKQKVPLFETVKEYRICILNIGEIPVGMQSRFNEDTPYWPQFNTATYKEVWGSSAGKWFSLISEF